jgi:hypothetical protein
MKVKIPVEFEVDTDDEEVAKTAAATAAWDYLSFCEVSGESTDTDEVTVNVDGHGKMTVRMGVEHG